MTLPAVDVMEEAGLRFVGRLLLGAFAAAFLLGGLGYVELGRLVGGGALGSAYFGLAILAAVQVAKGLVGLMLRSRPLGLLASVVRPGRCSSAGSCGCCAGSACWRGSRPRSTR